MALRVTILLFEGCFLSQPLTLSQINSHQFPRLWLYAPTHLASPTHSRLSKDCLEESDTAVSDSVLFE